MGLSSTLRCLLFFLGTCGICSGFLQENCTDYQLQFERVFSVPGDVAMLHSTLVSPDVFNFTSTPYNITWYDSKTGQEINNQAGRILVQGETLWFLRVELEDHGEYVTILRTPSQCYMQATKLVVDAPVVGDCGRPRKGYQTLTKGATDVLSCPLSDHINKLESYSISSSVQWYRGCELIEDGKGKYTYWDMIKLKIDNVDFQNNGSYTCTLTFTLGGVTGSMSETIDAWVREVYSLVPQVHEPGNQSIKAQIGSNYSQRCLVFVPCVGKPMVDIMWLVRNDFVMTSNPADRIYVSEYREWSQDVSPKGVWFERLLMFSELREEDLHVNYTCRVYSYRGLPEGYFTLLPEDPNIILPIGLLLGSMTVLFINSVIIYYLFKVDIVLWFRGAFPVLYPNKDLDGKQFDAYVAYPQPCADGFSEKVEEFALHTLPQVLEKACGYKLFIAGRDCLPGEAIVDSVEENLRASRRVLLLYTASTFISKRHTSSTSSNNNNISKSSENNQGKTTDDSSMNYESDKDVYSYTRQPFECVAAMHRALLEGSLKVVLVELEEISPAQLALFPESVRQLRKRQGAVCWWKNLRKRQRSGTCIRRREDEEKGGQDTQLSPSISPSSRFWKEMRYHLPVRGKRVVFPEKTALLNL
ncbi:interleukin-1 receptor type 1-like isoform X2 [Notolabrus celidotus]|nr:interleukin-1 receptor type 1-like isoform X2 [Notolabrus celidotus]XP_034549105.1 interleukin-1 receptor type 1-like isoform X2 [Notolabrus celidotus]